jgi:hypothetical protein
MIVLRVAPPTEPSRTGADLVAGIQASPDRDIDLAPLRMKMPVRDVRL